MSRFPLRRFALPLVAGASLFVSQLTLAAEALNFGIISTESSQALKESFEPFLKDCLLYTSPSPRD